jgi:hypothetical protein
MRNGLRQRTMGVELSAAKTTLILAAFVFGKRKCEIYAAVNCYCDKEI